MLVSYVRQMGKLVEPERSKTRWIAGKKIYSGTKIRILFDIIRA